MDVKWEEIFMLNSVMSKYYTLTGKTRHQIKAQYVLIILKHTGRI